MSQLCPGCMTEKENSPVCEYCGHDERQENQPHQLPVGTLLQNQYLIGKVLGQGGFGITYMGWDQYLSIPVAIKEYFPSGVVQRHTRLGTNVFCATGEAPELYAKHIERFLKEAKTLAKLADIPEIVQIKSFFSANDTAYIVMEYVRGITLKEHLKKLGRPMTEAETLSIMEPVLKALSKVHGQNLIHRDISPDNIMVQSDGSVKLIDFGTVRYVDASGASRSTEAVLKPGFAPMEQYNTRGNLGTWTDVYALCATYHYLLTGKVPAEVMDRMENGEKLDILRSRQGISSKLISTLEKGMKVRSANRIQTVEELHSLLYPKLKKQPDPAKLEKQRPRKEGKTAKKNGVLGVCAVAAVVVAAGALLMMPRSEDDGSVMKPDAIVHIQAEENATLENAQSEEEIKYAEAESLEADGEYGKAAIAFGKLGDYEDARERSFGLWRRVLEHKNISAGGSSTIALTVDGAIKLAGTKNGQWQDTQYWKDIESICAGTTFTVGLKSDGTVAIVGWYKAGEGDVSGWSDIVYIDCDDGRTAGVKSDGTLVTNGYNQYGQCDVDDWTEIVAVSISSVNTVGLRCDGTVVAIGDQNYGQCDVEDWSDIASISAGYGCTIGVKSDGTVLATGWNDYGQCNVSTWSDIISVSTSGVHTVGLRADGTVVAVGRNDNGQCNVEEWENIVAIATSGINTIGLKSDGTVVAIGDNTYGQRNVNQWTDIKLPVHHPQLD